MCKEVVANFKSFPGICLETGEYHENLQAEI
jgi:hypothetical protein